MKFGRIDDYLFAWPEGGVTLRAFVWEGKKRGYVNLKDALQEPRLLLQLILRARSQAFANVGRRYGGDRPPILTPTREEFLGDELYFGARFLWDISEDPKCSAAFAKWAYLMDQFLRRHPEIGNVPVSLEGLDRRLKDASNTIASIEQYLSRHRDRRTE